VLGIAIPAHSSITTRGTKLCSAVLIGIEVTKLGEAARTGLHWVMAWKKFPGRVVRGINIGRQPHIDQALSS